MSERFLPGVPGAEIESILNAASGNEIAIGKFDSPESSAALAVNVFGFFLRRDDAIIDGSDGYHLGKCVACSAGVVTFLLWRWQGRYSCGP